jgi:two-component system, LytTR family, response regulator
MTTCIIIDDEIDAQLTIEHMMIRHCPDIKIIEKAESVIDAIKKINLLEPDFIFVDIQLIDGTGFDVLEGLQRKVKVIFTTAYSNYGIEAIKNEAIDYLLKPINPLELKIAIERVTESIEKDNRLIKRHRLAIKKVNIKGEHNVEVVLSSDIIRCESEVNYTRFFLNNKEKILVSKTLKHFENELKDYGFIRVHQSHLININEIKNIDTSSNVINLINSDKVIPISRTFKSELLNSKLFHII